MNDKGDEEIAKLADTWTCHVCGEERPDDRISVHRRPLRGLEAQFPGTRQNIRYCNDRPACRDGAPSVDLFGG